MDRMNTLAIQTNDGWKPKSRKATQLVVATLRQFGKDDFLIGREVIEAAREALSDSDGRDMHKPFELPTRDGRGVEVQECVSLPGVFRMIINDGGFDRSEDRAAESFMAEVQQELGRLGL